MSGKEHEKQPTSSSDSLKQGYTLTRWVRWLLAKWWALLVLLVLGLLTNVLLLPLGRGFAQWWPGVQAQVTALIHLPLTQPYLAVLVAAVLPLLSLAGWWADRTLKQQDHDRLLEEADQVAKRSLENQPPQGAAAPSSQELLGTGRRHDCYHQITLPTNYLERTDLLAEVRTALLANAPAVALTSAVKGKPAALHGMGGIGKSVIARALCDDPTVREAFPDGILWATLGQTPNLIDQLRLWIEALGGRVSANAPTVESLKRTLAEQLKERTCLLILDDVWQYTHVSAFRVDVPHCRLLLTTRDAEIAREIGAQVQPIPVMTADDAITLLEEWADGHLTETDPELKEQIVKRLGYLPLAVKLAGAQLQRKAPDESHIPQFAKRDF